MVNPPRHGPVRPGAGSGRRRPGPLPLLKEAFIFRSASGVLSRTFELQDRAHARLLPMEGLRGTAASLVFLQHYCMQALMIGLDPGPASAFAGALRNYGNLGVELFFVLSGYLIYGHLVRRRPPFRTFMARRLVRIYPAFLAVFALALPVTLLAHASDKIPEGGWNAAAYLAANLALLPGLIPMSRVVDVAWSLSYEMFFYVATAALVLGAGAGRLGRGSRLAVLFGLVAAFVAACWAGVPGVPVRMMPFFAGMALAEGLGGFVPARAGWAAPLVGFAQLAAYPLPPVVGEAVQTLCFFALCAVCFRSAGRVSAWMTWAPLRRVGNMSYSYYLVHGFVVRAAMLGLGRLSPHGMPGWMFWALLPALYVATLAAGALLFVCVEKPISLRPRPPRAARLAPA